MLHATGCVFDRPVCTWWQILSCHREACLILCLAVAIVLHSKALQHAGWQTSERKHVVCLYEALLLYKYLRFFLLLL